MTTEEILNLIKNSREDKIAKGYNVEHNSNLKKNELLFAALSLIGVAYSQINNENRESEAKEFWPFSNFNPSQDPKENLIEACQFIISEIEKL